KHAQDAGVPIIVAVNKIDLPNANPDAILQQLNQYGLVPEAWGGTTPVVHISALKGTNLDKLEDVILTTAEMLELKASPNKKAVGTVIEAMLDQGRGPVATILISSGTLRQGSPCVVGLESGRIRALINDRGQKITEAGPATPVEILGLNGVPNAGDPFHQMDSEKEAKVIMEKRQELNRQQQAQKIKKVKLETLNQAIQDGNISELKLIIKADVRGSVEALQESLEKLSIPDIRVQVIMGATGEISDSDVMLASAGKAMIIAFNTKANARVREMADREGVVIKQYNIIYQVIDDIKASLTGMLAPEITLVVTGQMEVRETYKISAIGTAAGCMVTLGFIKRNSKIRVIRGGEIIFEGNLKSLKRFKEDAGEVKEGFECGILVEGFNDLTAGDVIEAYESRETERTLEDAAGKKPVKNKDE
ncbi:MAG: translation initiation factor IF-2, partial [Spirochaetia bacterium]|nr:translation initiation factor IF-2 [Spirochaetia bacterium]